MDNWKSRVKAELSDLESRYNKLLVFLESKACKDLSIVKISLLFRQRDIMKDYVDILKERLKS